MSITTSAVLVGIHIIKVSICIPSMPYIEIANIIVTNSMHIIIILLYCVQYTL